MDTAAVLRQAAAATAVAGVALGMAWRDSLPITVACIVAFRLGVGHLQDTTNLDAWRASLRCIALGLLGLAAATLLIALTTGALIGWWVVVHPHPRVVLAVMVVAGVLLTASRTSASGAWHELRAWVLLGALMLLAQQLAETGYAAPCLLVAGVGIHLAWNSWVVAHHVASDLLRGSERFP